MTSDQKPFYFSIRLTQNIHKKTNISAFKLFSPWDSAGMSTIDQVRRTSDIRKIPIRVWKLNEIYLQDIKLFKWN